MKGAKYFFFGWKFCTKHERWKRDQEWARAALKKQSQAFKISRECEFCENTFWHLCCLPPNPLYLTIPCYLAVLKQMKVTFKHFWRAYSFLRSLENYTERKFSTFECRKETLAVDISVRHLYQFTFFKAVPLHVHSCTLFFMYFLKSLMWNKFKLIQNKFSMI